MISNDTPSVYTAPVDTDEISLLDLLIVVVENLRLLVLGPIVAGLVALGVSFALPRTYESTALLKGKAQEASLITTPAVLDPVIQQLKLAEADESLDEARKRLRRDVKATFNAKDNLVTVTAKARSPEHAQVLLHAIAKSYFGQSKPRACVFPSKITPEQFFTGSIQGWAGAWEVGRGLREYQQTDG